MTTTSPISTDTSPDEPRSRRALLMGALGALAGVSLGTLGRTEAARAAAGDAITAGLPNNAGTAGTSLFTDSVSPAFTTINFGSGDAIRAIATDADRNGVWATATFAVPGAGAALRGDGGPNSGLIATSVGAGRAAVAGSHSITGGVAVEGHSSSPSGNGVGVRGRSSGDGGVGMHGSAESLTGRATGVVGSSSANAGTGVLGSTASTSGRSRGVIGESASPAGIGVLGRSSATTTSESGAVGVRGESAALAGVWGDATARDGIGVVGHVTATSDTDAAGVYGDTQARSGAGVEGWARAASGTTYGLYGTTGSGAGAGVRGTASAETGTSYGVYGDVASPGGLAIFGLGAARVTGDLTVHGSADAAAVAYRIDYPSSEAPNRTLRQGLVGSDQWKNIYDGVAICDGSGKAVVTLPSWFSRLNSDTRIQLTSIGIFSPVYVDQKVSGNSFKIAGGDGGQEIYWQVTGIRKDRWALAHPLRVEQSKRGREQGRLLHPEERGAPAARGVAEAYRLKRRRRRIR